MVNDIIGQVLDGYILYWVMAGFFALGIVLRLILLRTYKGYIKSASEMATTGKTWIKQLRSRFEALFRLKIGINSVKAFVERHVGQKKLMGIFMTTWERICRQSVVLSILFGSIGSILCLVAERDRMEPVLYICTGIWLAMLSLMADDLTGLEEKRHKLEAVMYDYLENILRIRLEKECMQDGGRPEDQRELIAASREAASVRQPDDRREAKAQKKAEKRRKAEEKRRLKLEKSYASKCERAEKKKRRLEEKLLKKQSKESKAKKEPQKAARTYADERKAELLAEKQRLGRQADALQRQKQAQRRESNEEGQAKPEPAAEAAVTKEDAAVRQTEPAAANAVKDKQEHKQPCIEESLIDDVLKEFFA